MKQATARLTALDTNVLARYYVQAEQTDAATTAQCEQARALLESGKPLFVATTAALELEWVLRGFYKLKPKTVAEVFTHLLAMPHLQVQDRQALQSACDALTQGLTLQTPCTTPAVAIAKCWSPLTPRVLPSERRRKDGRPKC